MRTRTIYAATLAVFALASHHAADAGGASRIEFGASPPPGTEAAMTAPFSEAVLTAATSDGNGQEIPLRYRTLYRSGDVFGETHAGRLVDRHGDALSISAPDKKGAAALGPFDAWSPDANSLIATKGAKSGRADADRLFLVTHFEYHTEAPSAIEKDPPVDLYANLPMAMNLAALDQDRRSGMLAPAALANIDMAAINGLWIPCAGRVTPWNTHLGGEEYEPDAEYFENRPFEAMNLYLGTLGRTAAQGGATPYDYGHPVEVKVSADGKSRADKHYAMGRISFELADIMPDGRTAIYGDDGKDVGLFMFVADRKRDLSAGTLYAARWLQEEAAGNGKAKLAWIRLGHARESEIRALVRHGARFSDLFQVADEPTEGFRAVYVYAGTGGKAKLEYLRLKPGMEKAAAFLETRRYAAYLGATTEFTKMEGQTHSAAKRKLYTAMSYIEGAMLEGGNGERPRDDIRLAGDAKDLICGAVYESALSGGQRDSSGKRIASRWVPVSMQTLVSGARKPAGQTEYGRYDRCDTDRIANPDNLHFSERLNTLFIGEDSGNHLNNFLWAYRVDDGKLTRLASAPIGAEWTGLQVVENANGFAYLMSNIQHPGAAKDLEQYPDEVKVAMRAKVDQRGVVGYFGPFPAWK